MLRRSTLQTPHCDNLRRPDDSFASFPCKTTEVPGQTIGTDDVGLRASIYRSRGWAEAHRALQSIQLLPRNILRESFWPTHCRYLIWLSSKDTSSALKSICWEGGLVTRTPPKAKELSRDLESKTARRRGREREICPKHLLAEFLASVGNPK